MVLCAPSVWGQCFFDPSLFQEQLAGAGLLEVAICFRVLAWRGWHTQRSYGAGGRRHGARMFGCVVRAISLARLPASAGPRRHRSYRSHRPVPEYAPASGAA